MIANDILLVLTQFKGSKYFLNNKFWSKADSCHHSWRNSNKIYSNYFPFSHPINLFNVCVLSLITIVVAFDVYFVTGWHISKTVLRLILRQTVKRVNAIWCFSDKIVEYKHL